jgi:phosphoserine aminotransferase
MNGLIEKRAVNFGPGPAKLPEAVLKQAERELYCFQTTGVSVLEMSHRSIHYAEMNKGAESELRGLMSIPINYKVLLLQGGGTGQFAAVPLNLMGGEKPVADYIVTGNWSNKAAIEAAKYLAVNYVVPKPAKFSGIPDQNEWNLTPTASYVYYCANETAHGIEFPFIPDTGEVPLVCDMSSNILTKEVDVSKFGVIIAGAQKNIGSAGVTVVIVREDLIGKAHKTCPAILDYKVNADAKSTYNTPPVYSVYIMKLVFEWISQQGGAPAMELNSKAKSGLVYGVIDEFDDVFL